MNWNEPAEWLRSYLGQIPLSTKPDVTWLDLLDQALAEERRVTVKRIRQAIEDQWVAFGEEWTAEGTEPGMRVPLIRASNIQTILDTEASR